MAQFSKCFVARFSLSLAVAVIVCKGTSRGELTVLKSFGYSDAAQEHPWSSLIEDNDGTLFGTTRNGGLHKAGTVFRINRDGTGHRIIHHFVAADEGGFPTASLVEGSDGLLYGTAAGGSSDGGSVFRLAKDGSSFTVLYRFVQEPGQLYVPTAIFEGSDRVIYGVTYYGGTSSRGTVYRLSTSGDGYQVLHNFSLPSGAHPVTLIEGTDGLLYGSSGLGGAFEKGAIFSLQKDGLNYRVLYHMGATANDGTGPTIIEASDGTLYGTTYSGTVFRIHKDGTQYQILHQFDGGSSPQGVLEGADGRLYGATAGTVFSLDKNGSNFRVLHALSPQDGYDPYSPPIQGSDGRLYGTTSVGGAAGEGSGTLYSVQTDGGNFVVLRNFHPSGHDGMRPIAPLVEGADGALYGTASRGGASIWGTVFKLNKDGSSYETLHSFLDLESEGQEPWSGVIEGTDGRLYGTTLHGGRDYSYGTVFSLRKNGTGFSVLHHFTPNTTPGDGGSPKTELVEAANGRLYGTTTVGGSSSGTIFGLDKDGGNYAVVHDFADVEGPPPGRLVKGSDGSFYGVTIWGGASGVGSVYRMNADGSAYTVIHSFSGTQEDGANPSELLQSIDTKLYGTTQRGGQFDAGAVFKMNTDGSDFSLLHSFPINGTQRPMPSHLTEGRDGMLYGTTMAGGDRTRGSIYALRKDGSRYCTLHSFGSGSKDPRLPHGVIHGSDNALYGTTELGGDLNFGIVLRFVIRPELTILVRGEVTELRARSISELLSIQASSDLSTWTEIASGHPADGELVVEQVTGIAPRFYRAVARQP